LICDDQVVVVEIVDQEEKLLVVVRWQWFDVLLQVVQVFDRLVNNLLLGHFLAEEA
jgi:hypothetical protein